MGCTLVPKAKLEECEHLYVITSGDLDISGLDYYKLRAFTSRFPYKAIKKTQERVERVIEGKEFGVFFF